MKTIKTAKSSGPKKKPAGKKKPPAADVWQLRLYVADRYRRRGLSQALMRALEEHAAQAGHRAVYLDTKDDLHAAIRLYDQLGYERCERYNDNPQATIFMRKRLG